MKKIAILLSLVAAFVLVSCDNERLFEYDKDTIKLDNAEVNLPKSVSDTAEPIHYVHITTGGEWEATLETANGNSWCWIQNYYVDAKGQNVYVATPLESFDGMEEMGRWCKVKGSGTVYLPLGYLTASANRYGVLKVRLINTGEVVTMRITQK